MEYSPKNETPKKRKRNGCDKRYRSNHPLLSVHIQMLKRCGLRKGGSELDLKYYANRGITVCKAWRHYPTFENWCLAHGWKKGLEIDRIRNNGDYKPSNCRFVTHLVNSRHTRHTHFVYFNGKRMSLAEAVEKSGTTTPLSTICDRINLWGWSFKDAITKPPKNRGRNARTSR